jgi:hypothetical protein
MNQSINIIKELVSETYKNSWIISAPNDLQEYHLSLINDINYPISCHFVKRPFAHTFNICDIDHANMTRLPCTKFHLTASLQSEVRNSQNQTINSTKEEVRSAIKFLHLQGKSTQKFKTKKPVVPIFTLQHV